MKKLVSAVLLSTVAAVSACGAGEDGASGDRVEVAAAFYPLHFAVEQIGGDSVEVTGLTKPGVEPHDLELSARDVATVAGADSVVYLKGFQSAVDEAVTTQAEGRGFDVAAAARLDIAASSQAHEGESEAEHESHADEGATDPHFWLDPERYAAVADAIADHLADVDPANADAYRTRSKAFTDKLTALDSEFSTGLKDCRSRELVTSHAAFGYLAEAYDLHQEGITGLSPEAEPSPAALARIAHFVEDEGVQTIYAETLVSPDVAETLARETGATVAVLDPIEGLTDTSAGDDYFAVMRSNLTALRTGQDCT